MIDVSAIGSIDTDVFQNGAAAAAMRPSTTASPATAAGASPRKDPFSRVVGQSSAVAFLRRVAEGIGLGGEPDPILLQGPSGRGKTLLASAFAEALSLPLISIQCGREVTPAAFVEKIAGYPDEAVIFMDEVHSLPKRTSETIYMAIDEAKVPALKGNSIDRIAPPVAIARHVWIAASNLPGGIIRALRSRLVTISLAEYTPTELATIARRKSEALDVRLAEEAIPFVARASAGSPRLIGQLLRALAVTTTSWRYDRDAQGLDDTIPLSMVEDIAGLMGIDRHGLDATSRSLLDAIARQKSGSSSAEALAIASGLDLSYVRERLAELRIRGLVTPRPGRGWTLVSNAHP